MTQDKLESTYLGLPEDYKQFLEGETFILENESNYLIFFNGNSLLRFNQEMDEDNYFPNMFFVAKNELSNAIAYNIQDMKIYSLPFIADEEDAILLADSFTEFMERFEKEEIEIY